MILKSDAIGNKCRILKASAPLLFLFAILAVFSPGVKAFAAQSPDIHVTIDGQPVEFADIGPQQINGRTMVPVRGVLEKLGANVSYNSQTQTVTASTPTMDIQLTIGSKIATVNAASVSLDVPAQSIRDHTFVPLRFLGEALGADIKWDADTNTVMIRTRGARPDRRDHPRDRPDDTPPPVPAPAVVPVINSFSQSSGKWLRAGEALETTLEGTPGGQASFRIPGLAEAVPMREVAPGRYVGAWQVPADSKLQLKSAAVIGSLKIGPNMAPLIQAADTVSVDAVPPQTRDITPEDQASINDPVPGISAVFDDDGSGIDRRSVRLLVNGADVTDQATVTRDFISYKPAARLQPGMQRVELRLADSAGNHTERRWTFVEQAPLAIAGIRSVSDNVDHALQPGDTIHTEMTGTPGGQATFSSGSIRNVPLREERPGHYVADYTIRKGDDVADKPISFRLLTADGQRFEQASRSVVRVATGKPVPPTVVSPAPNVVPANPMIISGRSARNARVHVRVEYRNRVLGVIALQGTAADTTVTADRQGNWQCDPINLGGILGNRGVEYTITATSINAVGEMSDPTIVRFRTQ